MTKYTEVEMSKQSSIEYLLELIRLNDKEFYAMLFDDKVIEKAKQMYENELREERIATYDKILNKLNGKGEN